MCTWTSADVLRISDFSFSHKLSKVGSSVHGDMFSFLLQVCLEPCFHIFQEQAADVDLLCGIYLLLWFGLELLFELAADQTVVCAAQCTEHLSCGKNVFQARLVHKHVVKKIPMFGQRMHPSWFQTNFLMEDCNRNGEFVLSRRRPLPLQLPTPCLPRTHIQAAESFPTLTLKSPIIRTLSFADMLLKCLRRSEMKLVLIAGLDIGVGA